MPIEPVSNNAAGSGILAIIPDCMLRFPLCHGLIYSFWLCICRRIVELALSPNNNEIRIYGKKGKDYTLEATLIEVTNEG